MSKLYMPALVGCQINGTNVKWTDEGREQMQESRDERSTMVTTAGGRNIKFIKAIKKKWVMNWTNVSQNQYQTIDGCWGRDEIRNFIFNTNNGNSFNFVIDNGANNQTSSAISAGYYASVEVYNSYIDNYQETIVLRRPGGNIYNLQIDVSEV